MKFGIKFCMCAIIGFTNFNYDKAASTKIISAMYDTLPNAEQHKYVVYNNEQTYLAQICKKNDKVKSPTSYNDNGNNYVTVFDGEIYNRQALIKRLRDYKIKLNSSADAELLLKCYILDGENCLNYFRGAFAFCIYDQTNDKLFLARDQIGIKPIFYYAKNKRFAFASKIKALFSHVTPTVGVSGLQELFGIGPARTPGKTVYKDISELKPGEYLIFENNKIRRKKYFNLYSRKHTDSTEETAKKIKDLLTNSIKQELISDNEIGMFLSGGLDSSIITAISSEQLNKTLKTFSVDYKGNAENFIPTDFTPTRDNQFIDLMVNKYNVQHEYKVIDSVALFNALQQSLVARDVPAMADIDSSLLLFCEKVKHEIGMCLSGEFADEIFCGYPWFYRKDTVDAKTFPWSIDLEIRENTLSKQIKDKLNIKAYIEKIYKKAVSSVPLSRNESQEDKLMKIYSHTTINFFGLNLLERTDRMGSQSGLQVRVPFTDIDLVQYVYNIPWKMKNCGGYEKGILRKAFQDKLPEKVAFRKKSPYPKTVDPEYTNLVESKVSDLIKDKENKLWQIVDLHYIEKVLQDKNNKTTRPWFGQLMSRPQYLAFILQIEMWLKAYNIVLDI